MGFEKSGLFKLVKPFSLCLLTIQCLFFFFKSIGQLSCGLKLLLPSDYTLRLNLTVSRWWEVLVAIINHMFMLSTGAVNVVWSGPHFAIPTLDQLSGPTPTFLCSDQRRAISVTDPPAPFAIESWDQYSFISLPNKTRLSNHFLKRRREVSEENDRQIPDL